MVLLICVVLSTVADEVGRRIGVRAERRGSGLDVVAEIRQARFDLGQQRVEVGQRLAELLAAAVERLSRSRRVSR